MIIMTGSSYMEGAEGKTNSLTLEIHQFSQMIPGIAYGGIRRASLSKGNLEFGVGIGSSDKQFKLTQRVLGNNGESSDTLPDTTIDSVKLTMHPKSGAGKTVVFSNVQFCKTNKMTQTLNLLSKDEVASYTEGDYMQLTIQVVHDKPEKKGSAKDGIPAWNIVIPVLLVLVVAGIAVEFLVRRKRTRGSYFSV